jgi:hypothetical protein
VDRLSIRSFRAADLAERGLKDLARSRLDTTREVVFEPLGARFFEARADAARIANLFREDGFHAPEGHFTRMVLRLEPRLADQLAGLAPRAVETRLGEAARNAIVREWPRAQGVYLVRFESSARGDLEPVAHVHLSSRRTDGGPAPALTRDDTRRFEDAWGREVGRALGLARGPEVERGRAVLGPEAERRRMEWARTSARLFAVYTERLAGRASRQELHDAVQQARVARAAWSREAGPPVDLRDVERRQVFDTARLRIEGGSRYLGGPLEAHRRALLETAASRAAGLPDGPDRRLAVVAWPAGRDLQAIVYFNQRSGPEAPPNAIDAERLRDALEARLRDELRRLAPSLDPTAAAREDELGRIDVRFPERVPVLERATPQSVRRDEPAPDVSAAAMVVTLDRAHENEALATGASRGDGEAPSEREQPREHDWSGERAFTIRLRVPTGAEQIERMNVSAEEAAHVVQRAVDRAYPFLEREGLRGNVLFAPRGRALDVQIVIPERLGWTPNQLRSPQFQQRFVAGFHQALSQVGPTRLGQARQPQLPGLARGAAAVGHAPQLLRRAEQDPERAAKDLARAVFSKLSEALPKPFRLMRDLSRTVSRFVPRG